MAAARKRTTKSQPVAEIIGRSAPPYMQSALYQSRYAITSVDATVPDYAFYDLLRRGKQPGYRLGALFARRVERLFSAWVFGEGVNVMLNKDIAETYDATAVEYTNEQLKNFVGSLLDAGQDNDGDDPDRDDQDGSLLLNIFEDAMGLGDQYIFVNVDGSLSIPSPDTVTVVRDPLDYRKILAVRITTRLQAATIIDEYTAIGRTVTVKVGDEETVEEYPNLIGRIQCVHVAYDRSGNETNGHSIHEDLLKLYDQYDDVLHKQLDGAKLLGNPIPTATGLKDLAAVIDANKPTVAAEYTDRDGNIVTRPELNIDANSFMLIGEGGDFKMVGPQPGFSADTKMALDSLFMLLLWRLGITESLWGGELSSARATSDTQLLQFAKELRGLQKDNGGWVARLCKIWLQFRALVDPQIIVDKLTVEWPAAVQEDKALLLQFANAAWTAGVVTPETYLKLLDLVDDPEAEVQAGQAEAKARADEQQQRTIAVAAATKPTGKAGAIGEMNGYNEGEENGLIRGAIRREAERIIAGE